AVPVSSNACHHALNQIGSAGMINGAKAKRIERSDRSGAHSEDVTDDTADSCRCAMVRFNERGVIVALDFEDDCKSIAYVNDSRIFTWSLKDLQSSRWQLTQETARAFIATVFGPHDGKDAQFFERGGATQSAKDLLVFVRRETMILSDLRSNCDNATHNFLM